MLWKAPVLIVVALLASLVVAVAALGGGMSAFKTNVSVVAGKPSEFKFTLSKKSVPKGTVVFAVKNRGTTGHDFKIAGKKTKNLNAGKATTLSVVLKKAGKYAYLCTVPGHAQAGMKGVLTVK